MKKTVIILALLAVVAGSCGQATKKQVEVTETDNFVNVSDSLKINKSLIYYFDAKIPVFDSITDISLLENIYAPTKISTDDYSKNGLQKALSALKEQYFSETKAADWDEEGNFDSIDDQINMNVFSKTDNFMTIIYTHEGYAGGAHGFHRETYKMFDLKNSNPVLLENIIKNSTDEIWSRILKDKLLANDEEIYEMLLVDTIPLNDNFYFDNKGITFVYNQYEIAAYAAGVIYIQIPFEEIRKLLMPDYKEIEKGGDDAISFINEKDLTIKIQK